MASKKVSKASKRRLITFGSISFIIISYFFYSVITYTLDIGHLSGQQKSLENKLSTLRKNEQNLKVEIQKLKDPEYVARYARENYLYSKDGEYIIKLDSSENENHPNDNYKLHVNDYRIIIGIGVISFIILILFLKKSLNKKAAKKK